MPPRPARRRLLTSALALAALPLAARLPAFAASAGMTADEASLHQAWAELEARHGGRLGVAVWDTGSGLRASHRGDERFIMCSTFKLVLVGQVLAAVDAGKESLERRLRWRGDDLVSWSPVTEKHVEDGLTMGELCEATITTSDNTAANLLLAEHGGPAGLTTWLRGIGDEVTRLDRFEPGLNVWHEGEPFDTTSPEAMLDTMHKLLLGDVLSPASRQQLTDWLIANKTGDNRIRAGLPGWKVGDKTGSDGKHTSNDIGIAWPPGGGAPALVVVYYTESDTDAATRDTVIASSAAAVQGRPARRAIPRNR
ncbi:MAG TPA: class A beta-lactamase [Pseudomonas sp.]|nr:class A beta-lactamase [Pseudomonas sp.]